MTGPAVGSLWRMWPHERVYRCTRLTPRSARFFWSDAGGSEVVTATLPLHWTWDPVDDDRPGETPTEAELEAARAVFHRVQRCCWRGGRSGEMECIASVARRGQMCRDHAEWAAAEEDGRR